MFQEHTELLEQLATSVRSVKDQATQASEETQIASADYAEKLEQLNEDMRQFSLQHNAQRREDRVLVNSLKTSVEQEVEKRQASTRELVTRKERLILECLDRRMNHIDSRLYGFDE